MNISQALSASAVSALLITGLGAAPAHAGGRDSDGDGIPNRWERSHGLNPRSAADAKRDLDKDALTNLVEYRLGSELDDEDSDDDGHDDGDEVKDGKASTDVDDADTDDDDVLDGDEDSDKDGVDNEDEDDASESCRRDDDDDDNDDVDDEDENELGLVAGDSDEDDDGILDGDEDSDEDGESNEDEDDDLEDRCDGDRDGDGRDDEDDEDLFGVIESFDAATGALTVTSLAGYTIVAIVTEDTEIEIEELESEEESEDEGEWDDEGSTADLLPGVQVAELEIDDETGAFEEIAIYRTM